MLYMTLSGVTWRHIHTHLRRSIFVLSSPFGLDHSYSPWVPSFYSFLVKIVAPGQFVHDVHYYNSHLYMLESFDIFHQHRPKPPGWDLYIVRTFCPYLVQSLMLYSIHVLYPEWRRMYYHRALGWMAEVMKKKYTTSCCSFLLRFVHDELVV